MAPRSGDGRRTKATSERNSDPRDHATPQAGANTERSADATSAPQAWRTLTRFPRETQHKEKLLIAAGFKVVVPRTAAQEQKLKALPSDRVTLVQKDGKTYYVFPDAANNRAYVGGPTQYQAYTQIRTAIQFRNESLEAAGFGEEADWRHLGWTGMGRTEIVAT